MKNILITGGAGFIGSNLTIKLVKKGYNITILDNLSDKVHPRREESELYKSVKDISNFILGDVCNKSDWIKALKGQDAIIHLAAETGTGESMYEIAKYNYTNIIGTSYMLDLLANDKHRVKKIIVASSRAIYGEGRYLCKEDGYVFPVKREKKDLIKGIFEPRCPKCKGNLEVQSTEEESISNPLSIYGITKYQQERMILLMGLALRIPSIALRYQNVYGPGQSLSNPYTGILSIFSTRLLNGNNIDVYEDGEESRDFIYIDDVVSATIMALEYKGVDNEIFNVGSGIPISVRDVAVRLKEEYTSKGRVVVGGGFRIGDIRHNYADMKKIKSILGFAPKISFSKGISSFVHWVKTQDVEEDRYEESMRELKEKGFMR